MDFGLEYETKKGLKFLTSRALQEKHSILIAFTTRGKGVSLHPYHSLNLDFKVGDNPKNVLKNRELVCQALDLNLERLTAAEQVHSDGVALVTPKLIGRGSRSLETAIPQTDALITDLKKVPLALFFADCVPIVLVDSVNKGVGLIHAGWKGTLAEIATKTFLELQKNFNSSSQDLLVFFGPSIGPCCYQVDEERAEGFRKKFPKSIIGQNSLHLEEANRQVLEKSGIPAQNFYSRISCTSCQNELFFSYRKEKFTGRQAALVCLL